MALNYIQYTHIHTYAHIFVLLCLYHGVFYRVWKSHLKYTNGIILLACFSEIMFIWPLVRDHLSIRTTLRGGLCREVLQYHYSLCLMCLPIFFMVASPAVFQWTFIQNSNILIQQNTFVNVSKMLSFLSGLNVFIFFTPILTILSLFQMHPRHRHGQTFGNLKQLQGDYPRFWLQE